jgi:DNA-binding NarL/FixJ family response regulator
VPDPGARGVAIVDDDEDARIGVAGVLTAAGRVAVPFATARAAVVAAEAGVFPPLALFDMDLPGERAGDAIRAVLRARPETLVVALTAHRRESFVLEALRAGAVGYLLKEDASTDLGDTLAIVEAGGSPIAPAVARGLLASFRDAEDAESPTGREREVLGLFAAGCSYVEAADRLGISVDTVRTYVRRAYAKLGARDRAEAVFKATRRGWLPR